MKALTGPGIGVEYSDSACTDSSIELNDHSIVKNMTFFFNTAASSQF
jgi:hypothetical protein